MIETTRRKHKAVVIYLMTALIFLGLVSSISIPHEAKTNPNPDNSLSLKEAENKKSPPRVEEDKGRRKLAFGDSTMALADSERDISANTCTHEKGTWVSRIGGITNLSCSGTTIKEALRQVENTDYLTEKTAEVFVTTSSNDYLYGKKQHDIDKDLEKLFTTIRDKSNGVHIIVVGYTKVKADKRCMNKQEIKRAREVNDQHKKANRSLKKALSDKDTYIDIYNIDYDICNSKTTMVRLPGTTKGTNWHTTGEGHKIISEKIIEHLTKKKKTDINENVREKHTPHAHHQGEENVQPKQQNHLPRPSHH